MATQYLYVSQGAIGNPSDVIYDASSPITTTTITLAYDPTVVRVMDVVQATILFRQFIESQGFEYPETAANPNV